MAVDVGLVRGLAARVGAADSGQDERDDVIAEGEQAVMVGAASGGSGSGVTRRACRPGFLHGACAGPRRLAGWCRFSAWPLPGPGRQERLRLTAAAARPGVDSLVRIERKPIAENSEASPTDQERH